MRLDGVHEKTGTRRCHTAITDRQATPIMPIRRQGCPRKEDCPAASATNQTLRATRHCGRTFRKRWTGFRARSRFKAKMRCPKAFAEHTAARHPDSLPAGLQIRVALSNRFNARGIAWLLQSAQPAHPASDQTFDLKGHFRKA
jgi:hypothetical protein